MLKWFDGHTMDLGRVLDGRLWNALEEPARRIRPEVAEVKSLLLEMGATAACLSGSGSCVFGLARSETHAREVAGGVGAAGHETVVVRSVGRRDR
jgi:4-diphosphocytidyl-2-C-methyl-D-erythritol kinase